MDNKLLLIAFIGFMIFSNLVFAIPGVPNAFYGTVTWNGQPAPDGTTVVAKIAGVQVASTTTSQGKYGYNPVFYVEDPNNDLCHPLCPEVKFFVNEADTGQTSYFCNFCVTNLNLVATGGTGGQQQGGGGGGGGGGGPIGGTTNQTGGTAQQPQPCQERWGCTEWSECINGVQTRTCNDVNNCGTRNNEPLTAQPCSVEKEEKTEIPTSPLGITGFFLGMPVSNWILGIIIGVVIAVLIIYFFRRKPKNRK